MRERMVSWCVLSALVAPVGAQSTTLVSSGGAGASADGASDLDVELSADGRFAAWSSAATNHVPNDSNSLRDVFVGDLATGVIELISVSSGGTQGNATSSDPSISGDGRFVAFHSTATNLVSPPTDGSGHVYVRDRLLGTTELVSRATGGAPAGGLSNYASISADGTRVAFVSTASDIVAGDSNGQRDVFVHDRTSGNSVRASVSSHGVEGNAASLYPSISADGRHVAFESLAVNLVMADINGSSDVFVHDLQTQTTVLASIASGGARPGAASGARISADGRRVAFSSGLVYVPDENNGQTDVFVRDLQSGTTTQASGAPSGPAQGGNSVATSISGDGRFVGFMSWAWNLVPGDTNSRRDAFVRDMEAGTTLRVSVYADGAEALDPSYYVSVSADGTRALFSSIAILDVVDANTVVDVYLRQLTAPNVGDAFCPGDGSAIPCPCGNTSPAASVSGCTNSLGTGGRLRAVGTPSVSGDTIVLVGDRMPNSSVLYFQGTTQISGGSGVAFGDGLRCVGGSITRLGATTNSGGASQRPAPGGTPISVTGGVPPFGGSRTYQAWYRNAASFCTPSTFNMTNGLAIQWQS